MGAHPATAAALAVLVGIGAIAGLTGCGSGGDEGAGSAAGPAAGRGSAPGVAAGSAGSGAAAAAGSADAPPADCEAIDATILGNLTPPDLRAHITPPMELRLRGALIEACRRDRWTAQALECAALVSPTVRQRCPGALSAAGERSAQSALVVEAMTAIAEPLSTAAPGAQRGPHPDYPTAQLAGTDKLFTMVEPQRGPKAPIAMTLPRGGLKWTAHAHCSADITGPVCSPAVADVPGLWSWRVGKRGADLVVVEERRGARAERTFVYLLRADGTPLQRVRFDAYDRVESALLFKGADRYSGRRRNGANALDGCGYHAYKLDPQRRVQEISCLQWRGEPMLDTEGVARTVVERDASGFVIDEARFDLAGQPVPSSEGVHRTRTERDASGRPAIERFRGVDGKPVASTQGCYGRRIERDAQGSPSRLVCLDAADRPTAQPSGVSAEVYRVDAQGCRTGVRYLSLRGTPAATSERIHAFDYDVDERCAITARTCLDLASQRKECTPGGPARTATQYDAAGNAISVKHYDERGNPSHDVAFHAFELARTYDRLGNQLTQSCRSVDGEAVSCPNTDFQAIHSTYDDAGRETSQSYRDEGGAPGGNFGSYKRSYKYDNYDHLVETLNHDEGGALTEAYGVAIRKDLFDTAHRRFAVLLYDRDGDPSNNPGCFTGATCPSRPWHAVRIVRRKDGTVEKNQFFDAGKKLIDTKFCSTTPCFD